jgi:hypothetical protein
LNYVEHLNGDAFPHESEGVVGGIYGGSLWSIFHGLQWPYIPRTTVGVSGSGWFDTGYEHISRGANSAADPNITYLVQQGRVVLRLTPTWSDGKYFVQSQVELVGNKDQSQSQPFTADTDDAWVRFGQWHAWDVQIGRYEAWEVYHLGMGMDLYTLERNGATDLIYGVPSIYGLTWAFYRPQTIGNVALNLYPTKNLRFQLHTQEGNDIGQNGIAARPVGVLDLGWLKVKGGAEYKKDSPQTDGAQGEQKSYGFGGSIQFVVDPVLEFGGNAAYGWVRTVDPSGAADPLRSFDTVSVGGFANVRIAGDLLAGVGANYTHEVDEHFDPTLNRNENFDHTQSFVALQYILWKQLFIKAVGAYALGRFAPTYGAPSYNDEMWSARLRLQYLF